MSEQNWMYEIDKNELALLIDVVAKIAIASIAKSALEEDIHDIFDELQNHENELVTKIVKGYREDCLQTYHNQKDIEWSGYDK
jgi:hypothetical protein